jgi:DNA repair photolyase
MGRRLNQIWGTEQRITDPEAVKKTLINALKNQNPRTIIAQALHAKKAIFLGRKADPYQPIELKKKVTQSLLEILIDLEWQVVVCSRYQENMDKDTELFLEGKNFVHLLTEITPGAEADWELFERKRTTPIADRLYFTKLWQTLGIKVGVRGEPYIPGYHTLKQFRDILKRLKSYGLTSYNTYNLHINEYTIKRFYAIGLDIEKIWTLNQDKHWKPLQKKLCQIADEEGITLGCPDFVNTGWGNYQKTNTCCGIDVNDALTFNTHTWKRILQNAEKRKVIPFAKEILNATWEGVGSDEDYKKGKVILTTEENEDFYTINDIGK